MTGRPPYKWTPEMEEEILERISDGESLRAICKDPWTPSQITVFKKIRVDESFARRYARAREDQADAIFGEIMQIADSTDPENVQVARLQIDARKWMAGKLRPKVYGEKLELSGNSEAPLTVSIVKYDIDKDS